MTRSRRLSTLLLSVLPLLLLALPAIAGAQTRATRGPSAGAETIRGNRALAVRTADQQLQGTSRDVFLQNWDDTAEDGYAWFDLQPGEFSEFVQRFNLGADRGVIDFVEACFFFDQPVDDFTYDVVVYRNSGGRPGALVDRVELQVPGRIETDFNELLCIEGTVDIPVTDERVFVGVRFPEVGETYLGIDTNGPNTTPGFERFAPGDWFEMPSADFPSYRNLAVGLEFAADDGPPPPTDCPVTACVPGAQTLCLQNDRFRVSASFVDQGGGSGPVLFAPELTPDTGYGYYQDPDNVELVLKVLNACPVNQHFWVFAGGLTDQQVTIDVCDTATGIQRTYFNPLKVPFQPITDTSAFGTCP